MNRALAILAAFAALTAFGYTPQAHTNSFTRDGVTYVQRGSLGTGEYVVTNVDAQAVSRVRSVNGKTGTVVLGASDVGALPDNQAQLEANTNFKNAVESVSPPVELPDYWALSHVTNAIGGTVKASDVSALPQTDRVELYDEDDCVYLYMWNDDAEAFFGVDTETAYFGVSELVNDRCAYLYPYGVETEKFTLNFPTNIIIGGYSVTNTSNFTLATREELANEVNDLAESLEELEESTSDSIGDIQEWESIAGANITTLQGNVSTIQGSVSTLQGSVSTLQGNMTTAQGNITTLQGNVSSIQGNVTSLQGSVSTLQGNVTTLQGNVSSLSSGKLDKNITAFTGSDSFATQFKNTFVTETELENKPVSTFTNDVQYLKKSEVQPVQVLAQLYDQPLQANWEARMVSGDMKLYVTTNEDTTVFIEARPVLQDQTQTAQKWSIGMRGGEMKFLTIYQ